MNYEVYEFTTDTNHMFYDFESLGIHGSISKRVKFVATDWPFVHNISLGDVMENNLVNDISISNNGDRDKVLATVIRVIDRHTNFYPEFSVYIEGSTDARTRLYRIAISMHLEELSEKFEILAETEEEIDFIPFRKNMQAYSFLVKRKKT